MEQQCFLVMFSEDSFQTCPVETSHPFYVFSSSMEERKKPIKPRDISWDPACARILWPLMKALAGHRLMLLVLQPPWDSKLIRPPELQTAGKRGASRCLQQDAINLSNRH